MARTLTRRKIALLTQRSIPVLPYAYCCIFLVGLYTVYESPSLIWYVLSGLIGSLFIVWLLVVKYKNITFEQVIVFLAPLFFALSGYGFFVLADTILLQAVVSIFVVAGLLVILRSLYFYHHKSKKYQPFSLQTQSQYLNTVTVFFATSVLYSLETFLSISQLLTASIFFVMLIGMYWQLMYLQNLKKSEQIYIVLFVCLLTQYFVAIGFLPFLVYVKGFVYVIGFYVFHELYMTSVRGLWKRDEVMRMVGIALGIIGVVLITTKWF